MLIRTVFVFLGGAVGGVLAFAAFLLWRLLTTRRPPNTGMAAFSVSVVGLMAVAVVGGLLAVAAMLLFRSR